MLAPQALGQGGFAQVVHHLRDRTGPVLRTLAPVREAPVARSSRRTRRRSPRSAARRKPGRRGMRQGFDTRDRQRDPGRLAVSPVGNCDDHRRGHTPAQSSPRREEPGIHRSLGDRAPLHHHAGSPRSCPWRCAGPRLQDRRRGLGAMSTFGLASSTTSNFDPVHEQFGAAQFIYGTVVSSSARSCWRRRSRSRRAVPDRAGAAAPRAHAIGRSSSCWRESPA